MGCDNDLWFLVVILVWGWEGLYRRTESGNFTGFIRCVSEDLAMRLTLRAFIRSEYLSFSCASKEWKTRTGIWQS